MPTIPLSDSLTGILSNGQVVINFPDHKGWKGLMSELEVVAANRSGDSCVFCVSAPAVGRSSQLLVNGWAPAGRTVYMTLQCCPPPPAW